MSSKPKAVIISDVHYSLNTIERADLAMNKAILKANELVVPLVVLGDLHDTKANIRSECLSRIIETLNKCESPPIILTGNHDRANEKTPGHVLMPALLSIEPFVVEHTCTMLGIYFIAYTHDPEDFKESLARADSKIIMMHQGVLGTQSGHYFQDSSAIPKEWLNHRIVISGHYHERQTQYLCPGSLTYVGNPYTLGWGESAHPDKGIHILYEDNYLEFVPLHIPAHKKISLDYNNLNIATNYDDILWLQITGPSSELRKLSKQTVADKFSITQDFKLDLIPEAKDLEITTLSKSPLEDIGKMLGEDTNLIGAYKELCESLTSK